MSERKPLTLEELRKMDGKPVWILRMEDDSGWWAIVRLGNDRANTEYGAYFMLSEYGKTWLAYAYEPTRIDRSAWEPCAYCGDYSGKCCANCWNGGKQAYQEPCKSCYCASKWKPKENFCPECGRPMTDAAWEMLEKRLEGRK